METTLSNISSVVARPLLSTMNLDSVIPRIQSSKQVFGLGSIKLERLGTGLGKDAGRRSSFLPMDWDEKTPVEKVRKVQHNVYAGATVVQINDPNSTTTVYKYCTGSKYMGEFNQVDMSGKGSGTTRRPRFDKIVKILDLQACTSTLTG